ncbi:MAG: pentapeptide repeat-containing protein [Phycisphaerae bacterium]|nr:pentapeptide repeat-containing protein [Phycisphaerae bacterium]
MNTKEEEKQLIERWEQSEENAGRKEAIIKDIKENNTNWVKHLQKGDAWEELPFIDSCKNRHLCSDNPSRDLRGVMISNETFNDIDVLAGTDFDYCTFENVTFYNVSFTGATLRYTKFDENCRFYDCKINHADISFADCREVIFERVDFTKSKLVGTCFAEAKLLNTDFSEVDSQPSHMRWG